MFTKAGCTIEKGNKVFVIGVRKNGLYQLQINMEDRPVACLATGTSKENALWHKRLGHISTGSLQTLAKKGMLKGLDYDPNNDKQICEACVFGKQHKDHFLRRSNGVRTDDLLELVHTEVCGPMEAASKGGSKYFVSFIDEYSRFVHIEPMKHKSEVLGLFKAYKARVELELVRKIKRLCSDNGGEYRNNAYNQLCLQVGIKREFIVAYNPQQNGVSERKNGSLMGMARSMLHGMGLNKDMWAKAVMTAAYIINRTPMKVLT